MLAKELEKLQMQTIRRRSTCKGVRVEGWSEGVNYYGYVMDVPWVHYGYFMGI